LGNLGKGRQRLGYPRPSHVRRAGAAASSGRDPEGFRAFFAKMNSCMKIFVIFLLQSNCVRMHNIFLCQFPRIYHWRIGIFLEQFWNFWEIYVQNMPFVHTGM